MSQVTKDLVAAGWRVEAEGKLIRPAGEFKMALATGIDWFELDGGIQYGDQNVSLPDLLAAARRGESMIELGDGSMGMLPEEWLKKYGMLADLATVTDGSLRFSSSQAGMLDALAGRSARNSGRCRFRKGPAKPAAIRGSGRCRFTARASTVSCAPISERDWAGLITSSGSALAASWPTIWVLARRFRYWLFSNGGGPTGRPRAHRWRSCHGHWSSTGCKRPPSLPRGFACLTTPAPAAIRCASRSSITT